MKKQLRTYGSCYKTAFLLLAMMMAGGWSRVSATQLTGTYTIDSSQAATTSNFKDFQSAITYLNSGNARPDGGPVNAAPYGVSGPVVFSISSGTYNVLNTISLDSVNGSSSTNTITFDGGSAGSCIVTGDIASNPVMRLNQCRFVSLQNITFQNMYNSTCSGIVIRGNSASDAGSNCSIKNCIVNIPNDASYSSVAIGVTGNARGTSSSNCRASSIEIENNTINAGGRGILFYGGGNIGFNFFNKIRNNTINNIYEIGIEVGNIRNAIEVIGNTISMLIDGSSSGMGIAVTNCNNSSSFSHRIVGNRIKDAGGYGMYLENVNGFQNNPTKILNNMISGGFRGNYGAGIWLYLQWDSYTEIVHNTVKYDAPGVTDNYMAALYTNGSANLVCKNNILMNTATSGRALPAYFETDPNAAGVNYNIYLNASSNDLVYRAGQVYNTSNYRAAQAGGDSSFSGLNTGDFVGINDLHLSNGCGARGVNLNALVANDIDGDSRPNSPMIGCDEASSSNHDISLLSILSPSGIANGTQNISVKFKNVGGQTLTSGSFKLIINGSLYSTYTYSGTLSACAIDSFVFPAAYNFAAGAVADMVIFSDMPNAQNDANPGNDTLRALFRGALSAGTYTINPAGSGINNFTSLESAVNALKAGILGPVTFSIAPGTYTLTNTLSIDSIPGSEAANMVTFESGNAATTIITGQIASNPLIRLNQCSYVTFRNLTIVNTNSGACSGITIRANTSNNAGTGCKIKRCIVNLPNTGSNVSAGISIVSNPDGYSQWAQRSDSIEVDSNIITGGYYGILSFGYSNENFNRGYKIRSNTVNGAYLYGITVNNIFNAIEVTGNTINMSVSGNISSAAVYFNGCQNNSGTNSHIIAYNRTQNAGQYGIWVNYANGSVTNPTKIYNNMIGGGFRNNGTGANGLAISVENGYYTQVFHNSVNGDVAYTGNSGTSSAVFYYAGSVNLICKNNIFMYTSTSGAGLAAYIETNPPASAVDHNLYLNNSSDRLLQKGGFNYTISNYRTAFAGGDSSYSEANLADFVSNVDLHLAQSCGLKGSATVAILTDIDGDTRTSSPTIGCDESNSSNLSDDVTMLSILNPTGLFNGNKNVKVKFRNSGSGILSSVDFTLTINNVVVATQPFSGSVPSCGIDSFEFSTPYNFASGGIFNVMVYATSPNGGVDQRKASDTLRASFTTSLDGGAYTIDPLGAGVSNFTSIGAAVNALRAGILGPVIFTIAPGIYTLSSAIEIPSIPGSDLYRVTFTGGVGNAASCIITGNTPYYLFSFNATKNFRLEYLTLIDSSSYGGGVFWNSNSGDNSGCCVKNCIVNLPNGDANSIPFGVFGSSSFVEIDSNIVNGGGIGIYDYGTGPASSSNNINHKIRFNVFNNIYDKAIYVNNINRGVEVSYNTINMRIGNTNSTGIHFTGYNQFGDMYQIIGNKVKNAGMYGISVNGQSGGVNNPTWILNNMITNKFSRNNSVGLYVYQGNPDGYYHIHHNSIMYEMQNAGEYSAAFQFESSSSNPNTLYCKNNVFIVKENSGKALPAVINASPASRINSNYYFNGSSSNLLKRQNLLYTAENFKDSLAGGDSSITSASFNYFVSDTNLHLVNPCFRGTDLSLLVPYDIDGDARSITPNIGCDETAVSAYTNDLELVEMLQPTGVFNGVNTVKVKIRNAGNSVVTAAKLVLSVNGTLVDSVVYSGSLLSCDIDSFQFATSINFIPGAAYAVAVYVKETNGSTDNNHGNDTLNIRMVGALAAGVYTINPNGTGTSNFTTVESAMNALNGGILGAVKFVFSPGTYSVTNILDIQEVRGASFANTIELDGLHPDSVILTGAISSNPVLRLNKCNYVKVTNLTIRNGFAGFCFGMMIVGDANNYAGRGCEVKRCKIQLPNIGSDFGLGLNVTSDPNGYSMVGSDSVTIDSNEFTGGGIRFVGVTNNNFNREIKVRGNHITNSQSEIYIEGVNHGLEVIGNTLEMLPGSYYGINIQFCDNSGVKSHKIAGNYVKNASIVGIFIRQVSGTIAFPTLVYNNIVNGGFTMDLTQNIAGIEIDGNPAISDYYGIYHNTIKFDLAGRFATLQAALLINANGANIACKNNILLKSATSGKSLTMVIQNGPTLAAGAINNNIYYNASSEDLFYIGNSYYNKTNFKIGGGDSSYNELPTFVADTFLKLTHACGRKGTNLLSLISADIDNQLRSATPDIGADEAVASNTDDIELVRVMNALPMSGAQNIKVLIKNVGLNIITSLNLTLKVNGLVVSNLSYSGTLTACGVDSLVFPVSYNFQVGDSFNMVIYTDNPNGVQDPNRTNDTIKSILYGAFVTGVYTIDPNGSGMTNFTSFTNACNALRRVGVNGNIQFNVSPAVYHEQVTLSNIPGASKTNTITFNGSGSQDCIVQYAPSGALDHTFLIENTPAVTLRNLSILNLGNDDGVTLRITGSSHFTKVKQCLISQKNAPHSLTYTRQISTIQFSSNQGGIDSCEIDSNTIRYGYRGIQLTGGFNNAIRYNRIDSTVTAISGNVSKGIEITGNTITNPIANNSTFGEAYTYTQPLQLSCPSTGLFQNCIVNISRNHIYGFAAAAISLDNVYSALKNRSKIANNMISGSNNGWNSGIVLTHTGSIDVFHNTVVCDAANAKASHSGFAYYQYESSENQVKNNYFACRTLSVLPLFINGGSGNTIDYNNYWAEQNGYLVRVDATSYTSANYVGANGYNVHSKNVFMPTIAVNDLHLRDMCSSQFGDTASYITYAIGGVDFDGQTRGINAEVGADYLGGVTNTLDLALDSIVSPKQGLSGATVVAVRIRNTGMTPVTTATIKYSINNGLPVTFAYAGSLNSCDITTVNFPVPFNFIPGYSYQIKAWVEMPNGITDVYPLNDTFVSSFCASLNGTYTINPQGSGGNNFVSIAAAIEQLYCAGVSGPVIFDLVSGTYNEPLVLGRKIQGASGTNQVTFKSQANNADSVTISYEPIESLIGVGFTVVGIDASYINIKYLTIIRTGLYNESAVIKFMGPYIPSYVTIEGCKLRTLPITGNMGRTVRGIDYWPSMGTPSGSYWTFKNNLLDSGVAGIRLLPSLSSPTPLHNITIEGNVFLNQQFDCSIQCRSGEDLVIQGNTIKSTFASNAYSGMLLSDGGNVIIKDNKLDFLAGAGISVSNFTSTLIMNNDVQGGKFLPSSSGLPVMGIRNYSYAYPDPRVIQCFNNSVRLFHGSSESSRGCWLNDYAILKNNVIVIDSGIALYTEHPASISDYNNLYAGQGGYIAGKSITQVRTDLASWRTATGQDLHSISYRPAFFNDSTLTPNPVDSANWSLNGRGIHLTEVTADINGKPRPANIAQGALDIGAYEFTPSSTPPAAMSSPATPAAGITQSFTFGGDTVAKITWAPASSVPSGVTVRQYSGEKPPSILSTAEHLYMYATVDMPNPGSAPNYTMSLNYRDSWLGTVANPNESSVKLAKKTVSDPWLTIGTSTVDTNENLLRASGNTELSVTFSAANIVHPLPVKLLTLTATNLKGDVHVSWATATETNGSYFVVERALDGKSFKSIGKVKARGNSDHISNYGMMDPKAPFSQSSTLYYRLRMVDADGSFEYSEVVTVTEKSLNKQPVVYPNPFNDELLTNIVLDEETTVKMTLLDITGKVLQTREVELGKGLQTIQLATQDLHAGMYFLTVEVQGKVYTQKVMKQ